ncbi:MAG TPA: hypothetical protein VMV94_09100 [Phycisphaerae bacterium]|nr:hypothetical protein [Phycisphaerae bacterium]
MTAIWTICALIAPWAAGTALVWALNGRRGGDHRGSGLLAIGAGWLAGQAMMMAAVYVSLVVLGNGHARAVLLILAGVAILLGGRVLAARGGTNARGEGGVAREAAAWTAGRTHGQRVAAVAGRVGMAVIVASLLAKLYLLICAHAFIPIRNDDAISIWLFKAKVIASLDQLPLDPGSDYHQGGSNPHYSPFVPLIAAWIPLVTGHWHEQLATLPWLFCYVNLVLLIAGGLGRWMTAAQSWIAAYLVASLPLMIIHAYRPGYADMILGAFLAGAALYLLIWRETNLARHLLLAAAFALTAACLKRESAALAAIIVLAVLLPSVGNVRAWSTRARLGALAFIGAIVLIVAVVVDTTEQKEAVVKLDYYPAVWAKLGQHLFAWSSFHFLFWALVAVAVTLSCSRRTSQVAPAILLTLGLCGFQAAVFLFTPQARFALNDQTPSRLFLQLVPSLVLAWGILFSSILKAPEEAAICTVPAGDIGEATGEQI